MTTLVQLHLASFSSTGVALITPYLAKKWQLKQGQMIRLEIGNKKASARIKWIRRKGAHLFLSRHLWHQLAIPLPKITRAIFDENCLRLGPVIGILTTGFTGSSTQPFGGRSLLFRHLIHEGATEKPFFYVFTPEMIDWKKKTVQGWYYDHHQWIARISPLPDVVYERVPNRKIESQIYVQKCLTRLRRLTHCQIFNQGFFNKWDIHQLLAQHPRTAIYFPETYLSPSVETIKELLQKHQMIYLKPSGGSLGLGIFRITHLPNKGYFCRFRQGNRNVLHRFRSVDHLIHRYFSSQTKRFQKYIAQQGIRLIKYENRPVDFRLHLHKNTDDAWETVAIGSKVAGSGCVTTHVRTGGSVLSTQSLLKKIYGPLAKEMKYRLQNAAIEIANTLDEQTDGPLGELGLDMGIDTEGRIWLFEINAKPGRHIFDHPSLKEAGRRSAKYITDYSLKLANFV